MELLIISGMSGAGKSQAANVLEDMGYYCVDNIPPRIIPAFIELSKRGDAELSKIAIVTDIRGGTLFHEIASVLDTLKRENVEYHILFLDAQDDILVRRYKENRRRHPLSDNDDIPVSEAIKKERELLSKIRFISDYILDTSNLSNSQLKVQLARIFTGNDNSDLKIICRSFGFKYGADIDADIVYDVRCLPNPFYVENLKHKTGLSEDVRAYVMNSKESEIFKEKIFDFIDFAIPLYCKEGKSQLVISFGCTGGKHRSVTFAELLHKHLREMGIDAGVMHRDIDKN